MKQLYLIRHAKASDDYTRILDFDRPLKSKGILQAHQIATKLINKGIKPDAILSSTAARALQTAQIFALKNELNYDQIIHDSSIYEASVEKIIQAIAQIKDEHQHLFVFGHNPSITNMANYLLDSFMTEIPVCGVVCIKIESDTWKDLNKNRHHLLFFDIPDKIEDKEKTNPIVEIKTNVESNAPKI